MCCCRTTVSLALSSKKEEEQFFVSQRPRDVQKLCAVIGDAYFEHVALPPQVGRDKLGRFPGCPLYGCADDFGIGMKLLRHYL